MGEREIGIGEREREGWGKERWNERQEWDRETGEKERVRKTGMRERERERETGVSERESQGRKRGRDGEKERVTDRGKRGILQHK